MTSVGKAGPVGRAARVVFQPSRIIMRVWSCGMCSDLQGASWEA